LERAAVFRLGPKWGRESEEVGGKTIVAEPSSIHPGKKGGGRGKKARSLCGSKQPQNKDPGGTGGARAKPLKREKEQKKNNGAQLVGPLFLVAR